ncbi:MAG: mechanosensitive ion channel family protein [Variovorax sp.]|nr:MAG: mechanosensitive ion channel family protein [Variovorax sp.]
MAVLAGLASIAAAAAEGSHPEQELEQAAVELDGRTLFHVRSPSSFPAKERAAGIAGRIEAAARDRTLDPASVRTGTSDGLTAIFAGPIRIMVVTDADAQLEQTPVSALAYANEARVRSAIVDWRAARTPERVRRAALLAAGATLLYLVAAALSIWLTTRLGQRVERALHARVRTVGIQSFAIVRAERIRTAVSRLLNLLRILALLALTVVWLIYVLELFPRTTGAGNVLIRLVVTPLETLGRGFVAAIPNLIFLVVVYFIVRLVLRITRLFFEAVERGKVALDHFEPEWAMPTYKIVRLAIVVLGLVIAYPYIPGSDSAAFKGMSLFLGVVFSLGSSTAISNIIAGYLMTYRRAFREGDRVKIGDVMGDVTAMRLQVTHLRTTKNEEVVIPNSQIINGHVINYSTLARKEGLLLHTTVGIGYETPWRQVEAMLLEAARRTEGIAATPKPFVHQESLGDFAVTYELNAGCDDPRRMNHLYSALHRNILDVFNEYGVAIMTPAYEVDPEEPKVVPKEKWYLPPARPEKG